MSSFTQGPRKTFSPKTGVDLSAKQYYIVKLDSVNTVDLASASTDFILGTINNVDKSGQEVEVYMRNGASSHKVILGGTVASLGLYLTSDSAGKAISTTTTTDQVIGRALQTGVAGDIIEYAPSGFLKYA